MGTVITTVDWMKLVTVLNLAFLCAPLSASAVSFNISMVATASFCTSSFGHPSLRVAIRLSCRLGAGRPDHNVCLCIDLLHDD